MADIEKSRPAGPTTGDQVREFEAWIGEELPPDYQAFLLEHNGGQPQPDGFCYQSDEPNNGVFCFFPLLGLDAEHASTGTIDDLLKFPLHKAWIDLQSELETMCDELEIEDFDEVLLPIGTDGCGNYICLELTSAGVVFYDHETWERTPLADDFTKFLDKLTERTE